MALISTSSAIRFDVAEGPTKADNGENDNMVINRENDKWQNFSFRDDGADDDTVLMDL